MQKKIPSIQLSKIPRYMRILLSDPFFFGFELHFLIIFTHLDLIKIYLQNISDSKNRLSLLILHLLLTNKIIIRPVQIDYDLLYLKKF